MGSLTLRQVERALVIHRAIQAKCKTHEMVLLKINDSERICLYITAPSVPVRFFHYKWNAVKQEWEGTS